MKSAMASRPSSAPFGSTPFGWRDSPLLAEALVTLALASAAIRLLPFRRVAALAGSGRLGSGRVRGDPGYIDAVRRAVLACRGACRGASCVFNRGWRCI